LSFQPVSQYYELVALPTKDAVLEYELEDVKVCEIDPSLADTAAFCEYYDIGLDVSANCVIVEARRGDKTWYAACMVLAMTKADINGVIRRHLDARKLSFASMDKAISLTHMEYGGITPIGLPDDWPILVDSQVAGLKSAVIGSGVRGSKLLVSGELLAKLPNAIVISITKD
jgi:prolyl-tRNA editing enzyme YbaK/EbsC (Cys-tRNA(Pro) deacylase)